ncbi:MAG: alpha-galactosidase [Clostridiales bacterium]|jgi:alpha-galactosidase|nr:alpha-galactosidase [Clostridiales bacterium]
MNPIIGSTARGNEPFFDAFRITDKDGETYCYRTGLTVYEEVFRGGHLTSGGFNFAGFPQNTLDNDPVRIPESGLKPHDVFSFELDGRTAEARLENISFEKRVEVRENGESFLHCIHTLSCRGMDFTVRVHTELDGTRSLVRYLELENSGERTVRIGSITPLSGCLEEFDGYKEFSSSGDPSKTYSLGYMDCASWGNEGLFRWHDLPKGGTYFGGRYEDDRYRHPSAFIRNNLLGSITNIQLGYFGGYRFSFNHQTDTASAGMIGQSTYKTRLLFSVMLHSPNPQGILRKGEKLVTPKVHFSKISGSLDDSVNAMHDHLRKSVFTLPKPRGRTGVLAAGMGAERDMTMEAIKYFVDTAAELGAEYFILDAGWYCSPGREGLDWWAKAGDWEFNTDLYPNGGEEIVKYVKSRGLRFGLWLDAERVGPKSKVWEEHPEWRGLKYSEDERGSILDMSNLEVVAWVESELIRIFERYDVELFRLDYNVSTKDLSCMGEKDGETYCTTLEYCDNVNAMYRRLRKKFPNMLFENCAGGGGRTDIGTVQNFTHTWVSDWQVAPRSFAITNGMTMVLPPEYVDRLASGMHSLTRGSLDFIIRQTLFGKPTTNSYAPVGGEPNPAQLAFVKHCYDIYKDFMAHMMEDGRIYHHTPEVFESRPKGTGIIERGTKDLSRSVIGVFRLADAASKEDVIVFPRGIDVGGTYKVTLDNQALKGAASAEVSGFEIMNRGIRVRLKDSISSELVLLERV